MVKLRVPSLQHLARNWRPESRLITNSLVRLARNPPSFNYNPLYPAIRDLLVLNVPYDQVVEGIKRGVKRSDVRQNLLEILPLLQRHFADVSPDFVQSIGRRHYPVGRDLMVPFEPPLIYSVGGQFYFPWFSFWKSNSLAKNRLALFVTLVEEMLLQDPDLDSAKFEILDFSAPISKGKRELQVIDASEVPRLDDETKMAMLEIFVQGYQAALDELATDKPSPTREDDRPDKGDQPDQPGLFD